MSDIWSKDIRYGPYILRVWYDGESRPYAWTRVPDFYSKAPDWLAQAMDAYVENKGYAGLELRPYLVTLFGDTA